MRLNILLLCLVLGSVSTLNGQSDYRFHEPAGSLAYRTATVQDSTPGRDAGARSAPLFYDLRELPSAERLAAMPPKRRAARLAAARRTMTPKVLIQFASERQWEDLQSTQPTARMKSLVDGWTLVRYRDADAAFQAVKWMTSRGGYVFSPIFARQMSKKQTAGLQREVNDPLVDKQWHLHVEQGIRMRGSWDFATGEGINIAVIDDGLEVAHEDLAPNAYPLEGNFHRNFNDGPENDPTPRKLGENHGTACAGLAAARGFNNLGVIGVAPEARLMGLRLIAGENDDEQTAAAFLWQPEGVLTHVSSNSWGPQDDGADQGRLGSLAKAALAKATGEYRDGRGVVFAFSAGNGRGEGDDSSYDEFSGNRFVISVGAVNKEGKPSSYSEQGISVAVSALGGESAPPEMIWTTNNSGDEEIAKLMKEQEASKAPVNYTDAFNGTSAAAPQVSGAAALLLQLNPNLGYRDVKEILMKTARREGLSEGDAFARNGGDFFFSHSFGAGVIDVAAALEAARGWTNLGPLRMVEATAEDGASIPDDSLDGATATLDFGGAAALRVEHVEFTVDVAHKKRGDLGFVLTSPSGMRSIADPRAADEGENFEKYTFTSVRHWGENSAGVWRVQAIDTKGNGITGVLQRVTVRIHGTER